MLKQRYIQRIATNLRDSDAVAKIVRLYTRQLADDISFIKPRTEFRLNPGINLEDLVKKDGEKAFLEKLKNYKNNKGSVLHAKTKQMIKQINRLKKDRSMTISMLMSGDDSKIDLKQGVFTRGCSA